MNKVFRTQFSLQSGVKGWSLESQYSIFNLLWDFNNGYPGWVSKSFSAGFFYSNNVDRDHSKWLQKPNTSRRIAIGITEGWYFFGGTH